MKENDLNIEDLIIYDGVCLLCTASLMFVVKRDSKKKFKFTSLQSPRGQAILKKLNLPLREFQTFIFVSKQHYYTKSDAALQVIRRLDGLWPLLFSLVVIPRPIRDFFYDRIARNRYRLFGKRDHCFVPGADLDDRFLK